MDSFIRALYFGEIVSPLATDTCGVDVGSTSMQAGRAVSCRQCSVAAESTSATGILLVVSTEMADKEFLIGLSTGIPVQHHQVQLRVEPPCMFVNVAVATWLGPGVKQSPPMWAQLPWV